MGAHRDAAAPLAALDRAGDGARVAAMTAAATAIAVGGLVAIAVLAMARVLR